MGAPALAVNTELFLPAREMLLFTELYRELAKVTTQETRQALKGVLLQVQDLCTVDFIDDDPEMVIFVDIGQESWVFGEAVLTASRANCSSRQMYTLEFFHNYGRNDSCKCFESWL